MPNTMKKQITSTIAKEDHPSTWRVYEAPWGWSVEIFDSQRKQIFSGSMYPSHAEAERAIERFLLAHPGLTTCLQLSLRFDE